MKPSPLPVHPRPLPGEWLGSWLARVAEGNAITLDHLLELARLRPQHLPEKRDLVRLAQITATTAQDLVSLVPREEYLPGPGGHSFLGAGRIQFCRECLKQDVVPYYRSRWPLATTASCPQHGGPLEQECPFCKAPIRLLGSRRMDTEVKPSQRPEQDLRCCPSCGGDLAAGDAELTLLPTITRPAMRIPRNPLTPRHWERFITALRQLYTTFRLYEFLGAGTIALDGITNPPSSPLQLDNRFKADQFMAWACGEHGGNFLLIHRRLRLLSGTLLGMVAAHPLRSDTRLIYLAWLLTRLRDDQMQFALTQWPVLVNEVCHRLTSPPPAPEGPFLLSDRQWQAVSPAFPGEEPTVVRPALEGILEGAVRQNRPDRAPPHLAAWTDRGQLGLALSLLFDQVLRRHPYRGAMQWERIDEDDQRVARLLLSDGLVELARTLAPTVHRRLLYLLIGRLRLYRE